MKQLIKLSSIISMLTLPAALMAQQQYMAAGRQALAPVPVQTTGVKQAVISLSGVWDINFNAMSATGGWKQIQVPGEPAMQGFPVNHDQPFFYRKKFTVPADAAGKDLAIRFNGVYSYARVWINGQLLREHFGGFTAWECNITPYVKPGTAAVLVVEVTDRIDDISFASGYAHHPIGGILRDVQLIARPSVYLNHCYTYTDLSADFTAGTLRMDLGVTSPKEHLTVAYTLTAPDGRKTAAKTIPYPAGGMIHEAVQLPQVVTWNAETPHLYQLDITLLQAGKPVETISQQVGFRKVNINNKNQLLVNGMPVKLRGACHHDMNALLGRSTNRQQDSLDVILAKGANLNFIRTSHYPPSADLLEFCNRYGVYVQEETAICFVAQDRGGAYNKYSNTQNDTAYTSRYLGQLSEMIDRDRNNPAIIMWSIGNESGYGTNFQREYDFVKQIDTSRPVSWSWPYSALKENKRCFDIAVAHYPVYDGKGSDMGGIDKGMMHPDYPLLSDEWIHVACYNTDLLRYDPNLKDYWGRSMDTAWLNRFDVPGNIGGAIWGMIDETFHMPGKVTGYGPWGIVDVWRREKAEYWNTKKAYSPIRISRMDFESNKTGDILQIPVKNRFDHTSLSAITCKVVTDGKSTTLSLPGVAPHASGTIALPTSGMAGQSALLQFFDAASHLLDEEKITWGKQSLPAFTPSQQKYTGSDLITGMPIVVVNRPEHWDAFKNTRGIFSDTLRSATSEVREAGDYKTYQFRGMLGKYPVSYTVKQFTSGLMEIKYEADSIPAHTWEVGIKIPVAAALNQIEWNRRGYWTTYPKDHLSATSGIAEKNTSEITAYRTRPAGGIATDMTDYYLASAGEGLSAATSASEGYRAKKENIFTYTLSQKGMPGSIHVISNGNQAAKMEIDANGQQWLIVSDKWDYWSLSWGNFQGTPNKSQHVSGTVQLIIAP
ncbi:glycoside hydrolase family 2 TIM barrel-domain containing protein [Chitinophaga sp. RAB17]|uniref:glycoside hydrolase family 2 protein n=1 Tax=Chitinophaga sp. RAB17 TaxID=3233049 RepID=UPI003F9348B8